MSLQVYKFGGASVKDAEGVRNLVKIVSLCQTHDLLIVVSAMGKTTNALEELTGAHQGGSPTRALLESIKEYHSVILADLFGNAGHPVFDEVSNLFVEVEWVLEEDPHDDFDFVYDQVVSTGELISSKIVSAFLNQSGMRSAWLDARSFILTDNTYREARVDWPGTTARISGIPSMLENQVAVTQGFIGGTSENYTTTLGREGSDYSAAIFSYCLPAEAMTIWKDVPGVLNADPKLFPAAKKYPGLHYSEALEMTYYGATVIHPKTIKPLQDKAIPLWVKPFTSPGESGTVISDKDQDPALQPAIIVKKNQTLLSIAARDHSFITEHHLSEIFRMFASFSVKINMMQMSAISFSVCFDMDERKFGKLFSALENEYSMKYNTGLELLTIRHYRRDLIAELTAGKIVLLEQLSRTTAQLAVKEIH